MRSGLLVLALGLGTGCSSPPVEVETEPAAVDEVWLPASCEIQRELDDATARLRDAGVVEVVGGQPYEWAFSCEGSTLRVEVETRSSTAVGTAVLWLGAAPDPPRIVPILLDVGHGAEALRAMLKDPSRPASFNIDLATGVVWAP